VVKIFGAVATQPVSIPPTMYEAVFIVAKTETLAGIIRKFRDNVRHEREPEEVQAAVTGCFVNTSICGYRAVKNGMTGQAGFALGNQEVRISWTSDPGVLCIFPIGTIPSWMTTITLVATMEEADEVSDHGGSSMPDLDDYM
jgi:hypothetical protein